MYCENCGAKSPDGAMFCENCGARITAAAVTSEAWSAPGWNAAPVAGGYVAATASGSMVSAPVATGKSNVFKIIIVLVIVTVLAIGGVVGVLLMPKGYEKPFDYLEKAVNKRDASIAYKAFPDEVIEIIRKQDRVENDFSSMEKEYGSDVKAKIKVLSKFECSDSEAQEIEESYNQKLELTRKFNGMSYEYLDIKKVYKLNVSVTLEGSLKTDTETSEFVVGKIGSKWYIIQE